MTSLQPPTLGPKTHTLLAQAIKQEPASRCACLQKWHKADEERNGEKERRLGCHRLHHHFVMLGAARFSPTLQISPFSLYHLSHTDVRMSMTQQGHCFVVLFYLFLDNEKSAEGLAWGWLSHIFTHETRPGPYGPSTGGYLTLMTRWHQKHRS